GRNLFGRQRGLEISTGDQGNCPAADERIAQEVTDRGRVREILMKRFAILGFAVCALTMPLNAASVQPKRGGTITLAISRDMTVMNPLVDTSATQRRIRDLMFEPLLGIDPQGNLQARLAESWESAQDGKRYIFRLRKGVKFHNDQEMTAEDVKFAVDYSL